jgi:hypothetical protein
MSRSILKTWENLMSTWDFFPTWHFEKIPCQHGAPFPDEFLDPGMSSLTIILVSPEEPSLQNADFFSFLYLRDFRIFVEILPP